MQLNDILALPDDHYIPEPDMAEGRGCSVNKLRRDAVKKVGPPRTRMSRVILYRVGAFREWLRAQERDFEAERQGPRRRRRAT